MNLGRGAKVSEAVRDRLREAQDFRHFPEGRARFVGNDVGGHRSSAWGVFLINVLNDRFSSLAGGEIDIDVGPGLAVFGEKALEKEAAFDWVDTCYANCVAD